MAKKTREGGKPYFKRTHNSIAGLGRGGRPEDRTQDYFWLCLNEKCPKSENAMLNDDTARKHEANSPHEDCIVVSCEWVQGHHLPKKLVFAE